MTTTLKISGMSCMHCVMHVKKALAAVPGIAESQVEVGKAVVSGQYDLEAVKAAIADAGYEVVNVA
ncbi:MAG TPA: heavy-metal-associated domain-containing protein [Symbiobacteriaceae bacterium]|nr:heavy-metal-associated domain-containing protein [Symbiobacteriaceae bacterium]